MLSQEIASMKFPHPDHSPEGMQLSYLVQMEKGQDLWQKGWIRVEYYPQIIWQKSTAVRMHWQGVQLTNLFSWSDSYYTVIKGVQLGYICEHLG